MKTTFTPHFKSNPQALPVGINREHALLIGLIGGEQESFYTNSLTTGVNIEIHSISSSFQIKEESDIKSIFNFLKEEGERNAYDIIIPFFLSENDEERRELNIANHFLGISRFIYYCRNLNDFLAYCKQNPTIGITHEDLQRGLLAWDLGRLVIFARIAYDTNLINENEAWEYIEFADRRCREQFINWREVGISFLLGQVINYPGEEAFRKAIDYFLLTTESTESPWSKYTF